VCSGCTALQPPPVDADLYALLGLERRFFLEPQAIEEASRRMSRVVHPDKWAGKPAVMRRMSLQWSAAVTRARRVLLDPVRRARYLSTGDAEPKEAGGPPLDPSFLEEIFAWRMAAEDEPAAVRLRAQERERSLWSELEDVFRRWEARQGDLGPVESLLGQLKYVTHLARESAG
jgi:molecular chaperone HscB